MLIKFDDEKKEARVWLHAHKLLSVLNEITINNPTGMVEKKRKKKKSG